MDDQSFQAGEDLSAWRAVMQQPAFPHAARALAANMILACEEDAHLCAVCRDAGAYMTAMSAMYLDASGGLTLPLLKAICESSGLLSRGRARSLLQVLVHFDWLRPAPETRPTIYRPTPAFVAAWRRHLQLALLAAAKLEPSLATMAHGLERPGALSAFLAVQASRLYQLAQGRDPVPVLRQAFLHPNAGSQVMWSLILAGRADDFLSGEVLPISLGQVAARFGVARVQVRRVLIGAEREGLLRYDAGVGVRLLEPGRESIGMHLAYQLAELVGSGRAVLAQPNISDPARLAAVHSRAAD